MTEDQVTDQDVDLHDDDEEIMEAKHGKKVNENPALQGMLQKTLKKKVNAAKQNDQEMEEQADEDDSIPVTTKPAPKRTGDKGTQDPMPKTKAALMAAMMTKLQAMNKTDLQAMYNMEGFEGEDGEVVVEAPKADIAYEANFEDDLNALVSEEATLSNEFKGKAATIFEAAIKSKLSAEVDRLEEKYNEELAEEVASTKADMVEKIDSYLNYVVEQWIEDNKVAVQAGLRTEIAEKFMNNLKDLFTESYIDVPESKVDLVDELASEVQELEDKLNETTGQIIDMTEELESFKREQAIVEAAADLADTQYEKLKELVADLDWSDNFADKVKTVKESYFKKEAVETEADDTQIDEAFEVESSEAMGQYLDAIKRQTKS